MKKVLLTSTALVAFAGAASANDNIALSGWAEMGINGGTGVETQFFQDLDVTFTMSGETDAGLSFGATVDLDENSAFTPEDDGGASIYISGSWGKLTLGDTDGALDWALTEAGNVGNPGSISDAETSHAGYNGSYLDGLYDGQILRYDNTFGDFGVAVSLEMDHTYDTKLDSGWAVGFKYNTQLGAADLALGIGYQYAESASGLELPTGYAPEDEYVLPGNTKYNALGVSATVTLDSGLTAGLAFTQFNAKTDGLPKNADEVDFSHLGLGVGYKFDALSLHANYGVYNFDYEARGVKNDEVSGFGLAAGYDLGGGASVLFGYSTSDVKDYGITGPNGNTLTKSDQYSLGLKMKF